MTEMQKAMARLRAAVEADRADMALTEAAKNVHMVRLANLETARCLARCGVQVLAVGVREVKA